MDPVVKTIHMLEPGDHVIRLREMKLRGPRGGRYIHEGAEINGVFKASVLSRDSKRRVILFEDATYSMQASVSRFAKFEVRP